MDQSAKRFGVKQGPSRITVAVTIIGLVLGLGIRAFADSPSPFGQTHGTVVNHGSTATVTLNGSLAWGKPGSSCKKDAGVAIAWNDSDQGGYPIGPTKKSPITASVGVSGSGLNASDNTIHPATCSNGTYSWGSISHVYKTSTKTITACPVGYHIKNSKLAGGPGHDDDNSIEENGIAPDPSTCFTFHAPPPPTPTPTLPPPPHHNTHPALAIDKKVNGEDHASVPDRLQVFIGDTLIYTVDIKNTGDVPLTMSNIQDTLHANLVADCDKGNGAVLQPGDTISCSYIDFASSAAHNVVSATGTPPSGDPIDVTDGTFVSIRAGVTIPPVEEGAPPPAIVTNPNTTG